MSDIEFVLRHEIFIIDAHLEKPLPQDGKEKFIEALTTDVLKTLGMLPLGPLAIFDATDDRAPGWSFIQPITTSHMSGHYFLAPGEHPHIHMDIYSCESVDWRKLVECLSRHLPFLNWSADFIVRDVNPQKRSILAINSNNSDFQA
jgi:hypothetical protein